MKRTLFILLALLAVAAWADELVHQSDTSRMYGGVKMEYYFQDGCTSYIEETINSTQIINGRLYVYRDESGFLIDRNGKRHNNGIRHRYRDCYVAVNNKIVGPVTIEATYVPASNERWEWK